jgi:hypothetical protein
MTRDEERALRRKMLDELYAKVSDPELVEKTKAEREEKFDANWAKLAQDQAEHVAGEYAEYSALAKKESDDSRAKRREVNEDIARRGKAALIEEYRVRAKDSGIGKEPTKENIELLREYLKSNLKFFQRLEIIETAEVRVYVRNKGAAVNLDTGRGEWYSATEEFLSDINADQKRAKTIEEFSAVEIRRNRYEQQGRGLFAVGSGTYDKEEVYMRDGVTYAMPTMRMKVWLTTSLVENFSLNAVSDKIYFGDYTYYGGGIPVPVVSDISGEIETRLSPIGDFATFSVLLLDEALEHDRVFESAIDCDNENGTCEVRYDILLHYNDEEADTSSHFVEIDGEEVEITSELDCD